jgi:hypothetical protein
MILNLKLSVDQKLTHSRIHCHSVYSLLRADEDTVLFEKMAAELMPQMLAFLKSQIDVNTNVKADNGVPEMLRIPKSAEIPDEPEVVPEDVDEPSPSNKYRRPDFEPKDKVYCEPTKNDVLMGRGGQARHHSGNKAYLNDRDALHGWNSQATKKGKGVISQKLVDKVRGRGGRFLKLDKLVNRWYEVTNNAARYKASQALREERAAKDDATKREQNTKKRSRSTEDSEDAKPKAKKIKEGYTEEAPDSLSGDFDFFKSQIRGWDSDVTFEGKSVEEPSDPPCGDLDLMSLDLSLDDYFCSCLDDRLFDFTDKTIEAEALDPLFDFDDMANTISRR